MSNPRKTAASDINKIFPEIGMIADGKLRDGVKTIWFAIITEMPWNDIHDVPKNVHANADQSLVEHVRTVTQMAVALCEVAKTMTGREYDRDLLVAACLLHDASKPVEMEPIPGADVAPGKPKPARKSELGKNVQHGVYAAHKALALGLPLELVNLVITHTPQSNVSGKTWEAAALFYADFAETDAQLSLGSSKLHIERFAASK